MHSKLHGCIILVIIPIQTMHPHRNVIVDHQEFTLVRAFKPGYVITNTYDASTPQCNSSNNVAMVFYYYQQQSSMEMVQQGYIYP